MDRGSRGSGEQTPGPRAERIQMAPEQQRYLAYMLRLWQMGQDRRAWRASLENAHTGARHGFASLDALFAFLEENTDRGPCAVAGESRSGSGESQGQESEPYSSEENAALGGKDAKRPHQP